MVESSETAVLLGNSAGRRWHRGHHLDASTHEHETGEIDYALAKTHWGQGFMPEAAGAVVDWGFRQSRTA